MRGAANRGRGYRTWLTAVGTLALLGAAACAAPGPPETDRRPAEAPPAVAPVQPTAPAAPGGAAGQAAPGQARPADRAAPASIEARKGLYAAWSPERITELRRAEGLVGPGPQGRPPEPSFPSYLRKPQSIEDLMPAARAAVTQTGGRVPLGLVRAGEIVVIAVEWRVGPNGPGGDRPGLPRAQRRGRGDPLRQRPGRREAGGRRGHQEGRERFHGRRRAARGLAVLHVHHRRGARPRGDQAVDSGAQPRAATRPPGRR